MEEFWILILVLFFETNSLDKAESVQLEKTPLQTIDEIFGEGWWDNDKAEEWHKLTLELGQIESNSTDQNPLTESDHSGQIEPNSTDQNPPLTETDHYYNTNSNENVAENELKRKIIAKFHAMKEEFKQKGKFSAKERTQIEDKIAKYLKVTRTKIYDWKIEFGINQKIHNFGKKKNERKHLVEKFDQRKAEFKRAGLKTSYCHEIDETVVKELGLSLATIYRWKRELGQTKPTHKYSHSEQKELMKRYYKIKDQNPKIRDADIAKKMLKIGSATLVNWKKQFKRQQLHPNSVAGNSVEENAAAKIQEIRNSNSEIE